MKHIKIINFEEFADTKWMRFQDYSFASKDSLCQLAYQEIVKTSHSLPIAIISTERGFTFAAIQGLIPNLNFFVSSEGDWLGKYVPARYRVYPFLLGQSESSDELFLCVNTDSGLIGTGSQRFYSESGNPTEEVSDIFNVLRQLHEGDRKSLEMCKLLDEAGLITEWNLEFRDNEGTQKVSGLFRIDKNRFTKLEPDELKDLVITGALELAYAQISSEHQFDELSRVLQKRSKTEVGDCQATVDEIYVGQSDDALNFDNI